MNLKYYIIRGRGNDGLKFQLARIEDEQGNIYKSQYDMARQFSSTDELKSYLAKEVVKVAESDLTITPMEL